MAEAVASPDDAPCNARFNTKDMQNSLEALRACPSPPNHAPRASRPQKLQVDPQGAVVSVASSSRQAVPVAPPTPDIEPSSTLPAQQTLGVPKSGLLTPDKSVSSVFDNSARQLPARSLSKALSGSDTRPQKLSGAYLYPLMAVEDGIRRKWASNLRPRIDDALANSGDIRSRLRFTQELIQAKKRGFARIVSRGAVKPTIVITVANKEDRQRARRRLRRLDWVAGMKQDCGVSLMVVINPDYPKLASGSSSERRTALDYTITMNVPSLTGILCGGRINLPAPSQMTGQNTCTFGGVIIIDGQLYGLTAGHGLVRRSLDPSFGTRETSINSKRSRVSEGGVEDPTSPFVFEEDDYSVLSGSDNISLANSSVNLDSNDMSSPMEMHWNTGISDQLETAMLFPTEMSQEEIKLRNCDWALVKVPNISKLNMNKYLNPNGEKVWHTVDRIASDIDPPAGAVTVIFAPDYTVNGYLSPNLASHCVGPYLLDVRLIVLEDDLRTGCSGAWVLKSGELCGYIVAACAKIKWIYMIPIQSVFQDIRAVLNVQNIRLPTPEELSLPRGELGSMRKAAANKADHDPWHDFQLAIPISGPMELQTTECLYPTSPSSIPSFGSMDSPTATRSDRHTSQIRVKDPTIPEKDKEKRVLKRVKATTLRLLRYLTIAFLPCFQVTEIRDRRGALRTAGSAPRHVELELQPTRTSNSHFGSPLGLPSTKSTRSQPGTRGLTSPYLPPAESGGQPATVPGLFTPPSSAPWLSPTATAVPTSATNRHSSAPTVLYRDDHEDHKSFQFHTAPHSSGYPFPKYLNPQSRDFALFDHDIDAQMGEWAHNANHGKKSDDRSLSIVLSVNDDDDDRPETQLQEPVSIAPQAASDDPERNDKVVAGGKQWGLGSSVPIGIPDSHAFADFPWHLASRRVTSSNLMSEKGCGQSVSLPAEKGLHGSEEV